MAHCLDACKKQPPPKKASYKVPKTINSILKEASSLEEEDYYVLIFELINRAPPSQENMKKVMNFARDKKFPPTSRGDSKSADDERVCGQQRNVDPGAQSSSANAEMPPVAPVAAAASKVPLICRGDLTVTDQNFFMDVEKVTLSGSHRQVAGDIAIVNQKGRLVFWTYIKQEGVCMFNTKMTGLDESKMKIGMEISMVQKIMQKIFTGKTIWGVAIDNDLRSLDMDPKNLPFNAEIRDLQHFYVDFKGQPISLALLSTHFLDENVHETSHSSIADARITCLAYNKMLKFKSSGLTRFSCPAMDEIRMEPSKRMNNKDWDKCTCRVQASTGKKKKNKNRVNLSGFMNVDIDDLW